MKVTEVLTREEINAFIEPSNLRGFLAVATTWAMIATSFVLVAHWPSVFTIFVALVILGGRHLALAILMHDTSHYSLFRTRWLNDGIGSWLCAYPTWQDLKRYRKYHLRHHRFSGSPEDPDLSLIKGFPVSRASLLRKFLRDLVGVTGIKRVYGLILIDFGFIEYTVAADVRPLSQKGRTWFGILHTGAKNLYGLMFTNLSLFLVLLALGHPKLYLLWIGSYLTFFSVFVRIRSIAEHACTEMNLDPLKSTRTTHASLLARVTVAPHRVNYHLEHHLMMTVPYFRLPVLHRLLKKRGALKQAFVAKNYFEVLKLASKSD